MSNPLELELKAFVCCLLWVWEPEVGSSGRAGRPIISELPHQPFCIPSHPVCVWVSSLSRMRMHESEEGFPAALGNEDQWVCCPCFSLHLEQFAFRRGSYQSPGTFLRLSHCSSCQVRQHCLNSWMFVLCLTSLAWRMMLYLNYFSIVYWNY